MKEIKYWIICCIVFSILLILAAYKSRSEVFIANPAQLQTTLTWGPDSVCQTFHEFQYERSGGGWGDGNCDGTVANMADVLPIFYNPDTESLFYNSHWDGRHYLPPGVTMAGALSGDVLRPRRTNSPPGSQMSFWAHRAPDGWPTCPLFADPTVCQPAPICTDADGNNRCDENEFFFMSESGSCARSNLIVYQSIVGAFEAREFRPQGPADTLDPNPNNNQISDTAWRSGVAFTFPAADYAVLDFNIFRRHYYTLGTPQENLEWGYMQGGVGIGSDRHIRIEAFNCDGLPVGAPANRVETHQIYTGKSGQIWLPCDLNDFSYPFQGSGKRCTLGIGHSGAQMEAIVIDSVDGAALSLADIHTGDVYFGSTTDLGPPPFPIPPGEATEGVLEYGLTRDSPGCLPSTAAPFTLNPGIMHCYFNTVHILAQDPTLPGDGWTHRGDGYGWRHPGTPDEVNSLEPPLSLYPEFYLPEPGIGLGLLFGIGALACLRRS